MAVTSFQDLPLADRDRAVDGDAAEKRVRRWADAEDQLKREVPRRTCVVRRRRQGELHGVQALVADVIDGKLKAVPCGVMAAGNVMVGGRGGVSTCRTRTAIG